MVSPFGNKVTEKDLRDHLSGIGYYANSARVHELELVGIERPGWVQIFRCHVEAKHRETGWAELFGVIRDDERASFEVQLYESAEEQQSAVDDLTDGLITRPGASSRERQPLGPVIVAALLLFVGLMAAILYAR